jgi:hypothetical protein
VQETDPAAACELAQLVVLDTGSLQRSATHQPSARYSEPAVLKKWRKSAADTAVELVENLDRLENLLSNQAITQALHAANSHQLVSVAGEQHLNYCAAAFRIGLLLFRQLFDDGLSDEVGSDSIKLWLENDPQLESLKYKIMHLGVTPGYPFDERSAQFFRDLTVQIQSEQIRLLGHPENDSGGSKHETPRAKTKGKRGRKPATERDRKWATEFQDGLPESWKNLAAYANYKVGQTEVKVGLDAVKTAVKKGLQLLEKNKQ